MANRDPILDLITRVNRLAITSPLRNDPNNQKRGENLAASDETKENRDINSMPDDNRKNNDNIKSNKMEHQPLNTNVMKTPESSPTFASKSINDSIDISPISFNNTFDQPDELVAEDPSNYFSCVPDLSNETNKNVLNIEEESKGSELSSNAQPGASNVSFNIKHTAINEDKTAEETGPSTLHNDALSENVTVLLDEQLDASEKVNDANISEISTPESKPLKLDEESNFLNSSEKVDTFELHDKNLCTNFKELKSSMIKSDTVNPEDKFSSKKESKSTSLVELNKESNSSNSEENYTSELRDEMKSLIPKSDVLNQDKRLNDENVSKLTPESKPLVEFNKESNCLKSGQTYTQKLYTELIESLFPRSDENKSEILTPESKPHAELNKASFFTPSQKNYLKEISDEVMKSFKPKRNIRNRDKFSSKKQLNDKNMSEKVTPESKPHVELNKESNFSNSEENYTSELRDEEMKSLTPKSDILNQDKQLNDEKITKTLTPESTPLEELNKESNFSNSKENYTSELRDEIKSLVLKSDILNQDKQLNDEKMSKTLTPESSPLVELNKESNFSNSEENYTSELRDEEMKSLTPKRDILNQDKQLNDENMPEILTAESKPHVEVYKESNFLNSEKNCNLEFKDEEMKSLIPKSDILNEDKQLNDGNMPEILTPESKPQIKLHKDSNFSKSEENYTSELRDEEMKSLIPKSDILNEDKQLNDEKMSTTLTLESTPLVELNKESNLLNSEKNCTSEFHDGEMKSLTLKSDILNQEDTFSSENLTPESEQLVHVNKESNILNAPEKMDSFELHDEKSSIPKSNILNQIKFSSPEKQIDDENMYKTVTPESKQLVQLDKEYNILNASEKVNTSKLHDEEMKSSIPKSDILNEDKQLNVGNMSTTLMSESTPPVELNKESNFSNSEENYTSELRDQEMKSLIPNSDILNQDKFSPKKQLNDENISKILTPESKPLVQLDKESNILNAPEKIDLSQSNNEYVSANLNKTVSKSSPKKICDNETENVIQPNQELNSLSDKNESNSLNISNTDTTNIVKETNTSDLSKTPNYSRKSGKVDFKDIPEVIQEHIKSISSDSSLEESNSKQINTQTSQFKPLSNADDNENREISPNLLKIKRLSMGHKELSQIIPDFDLNNQNLAEPLETMDVDDEVAEKVSVAVQVENNSGETAAEEIRAINEKYGKIFDDFQTFIASTVEEKKRLENENETISNHITNLESAFADLLQKYERTKSLITGYKNNEKALINKCDELKRTNKNYEELYLNFKTKSRQVIEECNMKYATMKEKYESKINSLNAINKSYEIKMVSLQSSLKQKEQECKSLTELVDQYCRK